MLEFGFLSFVVYFRSFGVVVGWGRVEEVFAAVVKTTVRGYLGFGGSRRFFVGYVVFWVFVEVIN